MYAFNNTYVDQGSTSRKTGTGSVIYEPYNGIDLINNDLGLLKKGTLREILTTEFQKLVAEGLLATNSLVEIREQELQSEMVIDQLQKGF